MMLPRPTHIVMAGFVPAIHAALLPVENRSKPRKRGLIGNSGGA